MNKKIFDYTKSASKRLKSPRLFKTEGKQVSRSYIQKNQYSEQKSAYSYDLVVNDCLKLKSLERSKTINEKKDSIEKHDSKSMSKLTRNSYQKQPKLLKEKYSSFADTLLRLNQTKQMIRLPVRSRKQLWHNYTNLESSVPERKVKSQLHFTQPEELNNKYRSTASLYSQESCDQIQLNLQYAYRTKQGQIINNPNKVNQDIAVCQQNLTDEIHLFFVCDGHGLNGHHVSNYVKESLSKQLQKNPVFQLQIRDTLDQSIKHIAINVNKNEFDTQFSGTTLSGVILQENGKLYCFNVGDSRTILGKYQGNGRFKPFPLSIDHKPSLKKEQIRIKQNGGRVDTFHDQNGNSIGPMRVWVNSAQYPGLAMSRSLGDQVAQSVGVSSRPDIQEYQLGLADKFIILASDGVWEFLDNQTVIDIVGRFYLNKNLNGACEELMRTAYRMWTIEDDSVIDDITFIIIFLQN